MEIDLRDYFAAKAMQGDWAAQSDETGEFTDNTSDVSLQNKAKLFYRMADAMLEVRNSND